MFDNIHKHKSLFQYDLETNYYSLDWNRFLDILKNHVISTNIKMKNHKINNIFVNPGLASRG